MPAMRLPLALVLLSLTWACGDDDAVPADAGTDGSTDGGAADAQTDAGPDSGDAGPDSGDAGDDAAFDAGPPCEGPPGLYAAPTCTTLAEGVRAYDPLYWLWSDGSDKERYIRIPEGTQIDTSDPDHWVYPMGTQVWKTFLLDGVRLETRLFEKFGDGAGIDAWDTRTFAWNEEQNAVEELTAGRENVLGTDHDIPSRSQCLQCHFQSGRVDLLNGFSAIQLNHADAGYTLQELNDSGTLSAPIALADAVVPGDEVTREALGYLHSNCGPCHGTDRAPSGFRMWIDVGLATPEETDTYTTGVDVAALRTFPDATLRFAPGSVDGSVSLVRMNARTMIDQMPPLGTEFVHPEGVTIIENWVNSLAD